jgi:uncharacterized delta-60 repeat protein
MKPGLPPVLRVSACVCFAVAVSACTGAELFDDVHELRYPPPLPGTIDSRFGEGGVAQVSDAIDGKSVAVLPDGRILAAGTYYVSGGQHGGFVVLRYKRNGTLDHTFGTGGIATWPLSDTAYLTGMAVLPGGRVVVCGYVSNGTDHDMAVARCLQDGTADDTFGNNGLVVTDTGYDEYAEAVVIQPDGCVLLAGKRHVNGEGEALLVRYTANGALDGSFGNGGVVTTAGWVECAALQPDGKIVVAGNIVARYTSAGALDPSFGGDGFGDPSDVAHGITVQSDGRILLARSYSVCRRNEDGELDESFGTGGVANLDAGLGYGLLVQPSGKILVALRGQYPLQRFTSTGVPDHGFGPSGDAPGLSQAFVDIDSVAALAMQPDGGILVVGESKYTAPGRLMLLRYHQ